MATLKNNAFIAHYGEHLKISETIESLVDLRSLLSNTFGLTRNLAFRQNTTTAIIDLLQAIKSASSTHPTLVFSDLEHPAIQQAIELFWGDAPKVFLKLHHLLLKGEIDAIEREFCETTGPHNICFLSHVLWNAGVKLDVGHISELIKARHPDNVVIVDGAQAVGNIENPLIREEHIGHVDFYLGCTHKWTGSKNPLGFISAHKKYLKSKAFIRLLLCDPFSTYAGEIPGLDYDVRISTYNLPYLLTVTKELNELLQIGFDHPRFSPRMLYHITGGKHSLHMIPVPEQRRTRFAAIYGNDADISNLCKNLRVEKDLVFIDTQVSKGSSWLRVGV